jgi:uncharacterized membrane protein
MNVRFSFIGVACIVIVILVCGVYLYSVFNSIRDIQDIENAIESNLNRGSSSISEIEDFLDLQGFDYDFAEELNRFEVVLSEEDTLPFIVGRNYMVIYIDDQNRFADFKVYHTHK